MKTVCSLFVVVMLAVMCSASSQETQVAGRVSGTRVSGPAPVPICPPEEGWCETMPGDPQPKAVSGPAPVPICPPEEGWCETMPGDPQPKAVSGPAPVPICPPEEGWCETMPGDPQPKVVSGR